MWSKAQQRAKPGYTARNVGLINGSRQIWNWIEDLGKLLDPDK
jgi:hypothetical protein